ncbi:MAG: DNA-processing protein DprA [Gammaproteobacteria bacterium]
MYSHNTKMPSEKDIAYWLALWLVPTLSPRLFTQLVEHFNPLQNLFRASKEHLAQLGLKPHCIHAIQNPPWSTVDKHLKWAEHPNHHIITAQHPAYSTLLREIAQPPPILFARGNVGLLSHKQLAIVGSRRASGDGRQHARRFAYDMVERGYTITSGLAIGVDTYAHEGTLAHPKGDTIAVLGTGPNIIYPRRNAKLIEHIAERGLIVSEYPLDVAAQPYHFPRRNRIISGLSVGVLVVEAAAKSGSLITAHHALEQGREVFALPGHLQNPLSQGCHYLIQQGAKLVAHVTDIYNELEANNGKPPAHQEKKPTQEPLTGIKRVIFDCLGYESMGVEHIIAHTGLTAATVSAMLVPLEIAGYIKSQPDGGYRRS